MDTADPVIPETERMVGTLGEVLYSRVSKPPVSEAEWVSLVQLVASGDQRALHGLYERAHRLVFTLSLRITGNRESAEEVTLDVFHDVWRRAGLYRETDGTVLGWIMNQTRSRAIDRLRFEQRKKRVPGEVGDQVGTAAPPQPDAVVLLAQQRESLRLALDVLTADERLAIETAFFSELSYAETAAQLKKPIGTIKTRIRSGLHKLREALVEREHTR